MGPPVWLQTSLPKLRGVCVKHISDKVHLDPTSRLWDCKKTLLVVIIHISSINALYKMTCPRDSNLKSKSLPFSLFIRALNALEPSSELRRLWSRNFSALITLPKIWRVILCLWHARWDFSLLLWSSNFHPASQTSFENVLCFKSSLLCNVHVCVQCVCVLWREGKPQSLWILATTYFGWFKEPQKTKQKNHKPNFWSSPW